MRQRDDDGECGEARGDVHDDAAREVDDVLGAEEAPPQTQWQKGKYEVHPEGDEDEVGGEHHAVRERARHERGGDDGEHGLEA